MNNADRRMEVFEPCRLCRSGGGARIALWAWAMALLFLAGRALAAEAGPETAPAPLPAAQEVIDRFVRELGGKAAFDKIQSQHVKGKFEMSAQGMVGQLDVYAKRPDKLLIKIVLPGVGELLQGFDGNFGWSVNPITGPMVLEGKMLEQLHEQARFDSVLHEAKDVKSVETVARTQFEGKDCYKLRVIRQSGQEVTEYYSTQSGLLVASTEVQETPLGAINVTGLISEYKKFGDVLFATRMTQKMGPLAQVMSFDTIDFNGVDDAVFNLPDAVKALVKK